MTSDCPSSIQRSAAPFCYCVCGKARITPRTPSRRAFRKVSTVKCSRRWRCSPRRQQRRATPTTLARTYAAPQGKFSFRRSGAGTATLDPRLSRRPRLCARGLRRFAAELCRHDGRCSCGDRTQSSDCWGQRNP